MEFENGINGTRPGDERRFLHKKIFGGISSIAGLVGNVIPGASLVSGITGALAGKKQAIPQSFPQGISTAAGIPIGTSFQPGGGLQFIGPKGNGPCAPGTVMGPKGVCVSPKSPLGRERLQGQAVMGRFGPAAVAEDEIRSVAVCPTGMVLGKDGLCYDHLPNRDRLYPRGRRPLLTGGDMRAISRARRAGNRLATAKSDLIAIGMLKPAGPRRRKKKAPAVC